MVSTRLRVKGLLRERRWTTKVLAEKTGLSESYLTHIKNGTRRWNEDSLKKLAEAFELSPTEIFEVQSPIEMTATSIISKEIAETLATQSDKVKSDLKLVPIVGEIPEHPSDYANRIVQIETGYKDQFLPVLLDDINDPAIFSLCLEDNSLAPNFVKGDFLIISPGTWTNSGDIVAVEYGNEELTTRAIMQINFVDDFIVLESVNHKKAPIAITRNKDQYRIIGKVIYRYQKMA